MNKFTVVLVAPHDILQQTNLAWSKNVKLSHSFNESFLIMISS